MLKLVNKVVSVNGRRTSMSMSDEEWRALQKICGEEKISRNDLLSQIDNAKDKQMGLTQSTRLFIICYLCHIAMNETGEDNKELMNMIFQSWKS